MAEAKYPLWQCSEGSSIQLSVSLPFMLYNTSATPHKLQTRLTLQKNRGLLIKKVKKPQNPNTKQTRINSLINLKHSDYDYRLHILFELNFSIHLFCIVRLSFWLICYNYFFSHLKYGSFYKHQAHPLSNFDINYLDKQDTTILKRAPKQCLSLEN